MNVELSKEVKKLSLNEHLERINNGLEHIENTQRYLYRLNMDKAVNGILIAFIIGSILGFIGGYLL